MSDEPHVPAAFINAIAEEGTMAEAIQYLQMQWNENCALRAELKELRGRARGEVIRQHIAWLFQYVQCMNEQNWRDMRDNAARQLEQLSLEFPGQAADRNP